MAMLGATLPMSSHAILMPIQLYTALIICGLHCKTYGNVACSLNKLTELNNTVTYVYVILRRCSKSIDKYEDQLKL